MHRTRPVPKSSYVMSNSVKGRMISSETGFAQSGASGSDDLARETHIPIGKGTGSPNKTLRNVAEATRNILSDDGQSMVVRGD
jgi:hypothetical protein